MNTSQPKWIRCTRHNKCVVCDHGDWCGYCPEKNLACCMRVSSNRTAKNGGYLHPLNGEHKQYVPRAEPPAPPPIDAEQMMEDFAFDTDPDARDRFAESIGVTPESLRIIGCQRAANYCSWAFPMHGPDGRIVGIRLRRDNGSKFAVAGSKQGLFMAQKEPSKTIYIVEGASDLAALISMGLFGFGRPSCLGCTVAITANLARLNARRVVIVADNDDPGLNGAAALVKELDIPSVIFVPPAKDLRKAYRAGMNAQLLESLVNSQVWSDPASKLRKNQFQILDNHFNNVENRVKTNVRV